MIAPALDEALGRHGISHCRVLVHGDVAYAAGPQDEPLPVHSIRKSIISALIGQLIDGGRVRLDSTLAELGIDDSPHLTLREKSATLEQLHTEVLAGVDRLELQLRHDSDGQAPGEVRTTKESAIPPGYEEAVADYYRRLSKGQ